MYQAIKITNQNGDVFDTSPNVNIELNMGGVSLLNLSEKTVSYTNSFTLPRTPNNDRLFGYSGFKDSKNRPKIKIFIQKGLFFKGALMTVKSVTDSGYSCSIAYDENDIITALSNSYPHDIRTSEYFYPFDGSGYIYTLTTDPLSLEFAFVMVIYGAAQKLAIVDDLPEDGSRPFFTIFTNKAIICNEGQVGDGNYYTDNGNVFSGVWHLLHWISKSNGLKLTGSVIDDPLFQRLMIRQPKVKYYVDGVNCHAYPDSDINTAVKTTNKDVLNAILKMFFAEFSVDNGEFRIDKLSDRFARSYEGVRIEGFTFEKDMTSGYSSNKNYITYKAKDEADKYYASDYFEGEGSTGVTDVVTINSIIPDTDSVGYVTTPEAIGNDLMIAIDDANAAGTLQGQKSWDYGLSLSTITQIKKAAILDIAPVYSSFMSDIFKKPIILDVTGYMDMLTMDEVLKKRVIYSVGLGGQFWVETLAYSLVSGNCKMKLIKIF